MPEPWATVTRADPAAMALNPALEKNGRSSCLRSPGLRPTAYSPTGFPPLSNGWLRRLRYRV